MALRTIIASGDISTVTGEPSIVTPTTSGYTVNLSATASYSTPFTALNTTGKTTGVWVCVAAAPSNGGNIVLTLQESTVDTAAVTTINNADIKVGWQYARFTTPYQWTTTGASAYRFKVVNSVGSSGSLFRDGGGTLFAYMDTYDSPTTIGTTDDFWLAGINNSGNTAVTVTATGTSFVSGNGTNKTNSLGTNVRDVGMAIYIGNGGKLLWDNTATLTSIQTRGTTMIGTGGIYDRRADATDRTKVVKHVIDCDASVGEYGITTHPGGSFLVNGAPCTLYAEYVSGVGTAASPMILDRAVDWIVGEEIVIGGNAYNQVETRFIKTRNSSTSFVLSTTVGGAEAAWTNSHTATETVALLSRNSVTEPLTTTRGYWIYNNNTTDYLFDASYSRFYYPSLANGRGGLNIKPATNYKGRADGAVLYGGSSNRVGFNFSGVTDTDTIEGLTCYASSQNNVGTGTVDIRNVKNHTFNDLLFFSSSQQNATLNGTYGCTFNNYRSSGGNSAGSSFGDGIYMINCGSIVFNDVRIDSNRNRGITLVGTSGVTFNNPELGIIGSNVIDISTTSDTLNGVVFNDLLTSLSPTLISNYLNQVEGSVIGFHNYNGGATDHFWYTNHGKGQSAGASLTDTTVRTAASLSLVLKPEDATNGMSWTHNIPANSGTNVFENGYVYRNATFSSGVVKVELWLPTTSLSAAPDATYTFPTTTGSWLPYLISSYYSGSVSGLATVKITAVTATAGAYAFVDDLYDAGLTNKLAGMDIWDQGQPAPLIAAVDVSTVGGIVWNYPDSSPTINTMGRRQIDGADSAELASIK